MEQQDSIDLRSKEFQEVLGEPPHWLLRWGITCVLVGFILLFIVGFFLKYPETISAPIQLETSNPPIEIAAPTLGSLTDIAAENSQVSETDIIAHINNFGDFTSILALDSILDAYQASKRNVPNFIEIENWDLGPIKSDYLRFVQAFNGNGASNNNLAAQAYTSFDGKIADVNLEIEELNKQIEQKKERLLQIPITRKKLQDAYKESVSLEDNLKLRSLLADELNIKDDIASLNNVIASKNREIERLTYQKSDLQQGIRGNRITRQQNINIYLNALKSKINEWRSKHLIEAPISGTLVYQDKIKAKEYLVDKGQRIFAIVPHGAQDTIEGKLYLSSEDFTKVEIGQPVKIQFNAFRPSEYGLLYGKVMDKATLPQNGQYQVLVSLDNRMESSKGKTIKFEHKMQGNAQIITKDRRFTGLIFDQFLQMLNRN
jgi:biotin carboxyl carrier protein